MRSRRGGIAGCAAADRIACWRYDAHSRFGPYCWDYWQMKNHQVHCVPGEVFGREDGLDKLATLIDDHASPTIWTLPSATSLSTMMGASAVQLK